MKLLCNEILSLKLWYQSKNFFCYNQNSERLQILVYWLGDKLHAFSIGTCYYVYYFDKNLQMEAIQSYLYLFFLITGVPWGPIWSGSRGKGGRWGHQQTVWGPLHEKLWLVQNTGSGHQSRLAHGLHHSTERGKIWWFTHFLSQWRWLISTRSYQWLFSKGLQEMP